MKVVGNAIEARWDVNFTGVFKLTSSWTGGHFKSGTLHALERLTGVEQKLPVSRLKSSRVGDIL